MLERAQPHLDGIQAARTDAEAATAYARYCGYLESVVGQLQDENKRLCEKIGPVIEAADAWLDGEDARVPRELIDALRACVSANAGGSDA